jgi:hypothetical protein
MKKFALAAAFAGAASTAFAGGMSEPVKDVVVMEPEIVVEEAQQGSTAAGILIPLVLLALVAAAASAD